MPFSSSTVILSLALVIWCITTSIEAFAPIASTTTRVSRQSYPLWSSSNDLEEEVERMVQADIEKTNKMSRMANEKGVEYAPWMKISAEDEAKMRAIAREKAMARRKRQMEEQDVKGALLQDSTNQELSGTGLKFFVIDDNSVELEWSTGMETTETKGFIVKRRPAKTEEFDVIASYETFAPLASKGLDGGTYRYLDEGLPPGGWVYRITEVDGDAENDLSQCLVELQTPEEQRTQLIALGGIIAFAVAAIAAGVLFDPYQY